MISKNFIFIKPESLKEAWELYKNYIEQGRSVYYYSGGTEIVTFSRKGILNPDVLIDLKCIKECKGFHFNEDLLITGSCVSLNEIIESQISKILSISLKGVADHTVRNRITIGGNIVGQLPFREAVLPLLVLDSIIKIYGKEGVKEYKINEIFDKNLKIDKGDLLFQIMIPKNLLNLDFYYQRRVFFTKVDYPIISALFVKVDNKIRMSLTGALNYPIRDYEAEKILNDESLEKKEKIEKIVEKFKPEFKTDFRASKEYRLELFKNILNDAIYYFGG
ncbi:MAG: FAD binding domain-containing protein [Caldisericia bacterium]